MVIQMKIRVVLWGVGQQYNTMINLLRCYEDCNQIEIVGIIAKDLPCFRTLDGYKPLTMKEIDQIDYDYLMVMSDRYFDEIVNTAISMANVPRNKIISYRLLTVPYFNFQKYDLLKKQKISIVSNNCWGGIIYKTLNMECMSPFKNVSFSSNDYLKILNNLRHYLHVDPVWKGKMQLDVNQNREVPMLELDDVMIKCNHDFDAKEAIQKWKRRRDKFNWDNILVEMYTDDPAVEKAFGTISEKYKKRICFVPYDSEEKYSVTLPMIYDQAKFYEIVNGSAGIGRNAIIYDVFDMINGEVNYRLKMN